MYLTRVEIDYRRHSSARELVFVEAIHNWVERSFPQEFTTKQRSRKLWRLDRLQGKNYLLIVSATKPDLQILEHMYGVSGSAQSKDYNAYLQQQLRLGARLRFRLPLNPVIAKSSGCLRGKLKPHITEEYQLKYLASRAEKHGFSLKKGEFFVVERDWVVFHRCCQITKKPNHKGKKRPIALVKVIYEGVLTVTDVAALHQLLTLGMGKKKAYGFGMMTVVPFGSEHE